MRYHFSALRAVGGRVLTAITEKFSNPLKGKIGEAVTRAGISLRGETVIASQRTAEKTLTTLSGRAARAIPDFTVRQANGAIGFVEAKFGTSGLTGAQRALRNQVGDDLFRLSRTSYDDVANFGGSLGGGAARTFK